MSTVKALLMDIMCAWLGAAYTYRDRLTDNALSCSLRLIALWYFANQVGVTNAEPNV